MVPPFFSSLSNPSLKHNSILFSREEFLWCYSVFSSRSFPYQLIDPSSTEVSEVLFPLVDSLNHKPNTKITWTRNGDVETGSLSFVSGQVYGAGEEIFNNYGPKVKKRTKCIYHWM